MHSISTCLYVFCTVNKGTREKSSLPQTCIARSDFKVSPYGRITMMHGLTRIIFLGFVYWFLLSVAIKWQDICDDNAAIYNAGKINIKGDSMFLDITANNFDSTEVSRGLDSACVRRSTQESCPVVPFSKHKINSF